MKGSNIKSDIKCFKAFDLKLMHSIVQVSTAHQVIIKKTNDTNSMSSIIYIYLEVGQERDIF